MANRKADYPREPEKQEIENPTLDPNEPEQALWVHNQGPDEKPIGYHHDEGLRYVDSHCCGGECECPDDCPHDDAEVPELDMNPFEDVPGYYPESGDYHDETPPLMASKIAETKEEFPFSLKVLVEKYDKLEKIPFQIQMGGKVLEVVLCNDEDLYLIYELQQQVVYGVKGLKQEDVLSRVLAILIELWPTSVFEIDDIAGFRKQVMNNLLEWFLEFGEVSDKAATAIEDLQKALEDK